MSVKVDKKRQNNHTRERNSFLRNLFATFLKSLFKKYLLSNFRFMTLKGFPRPLSLRTLRSLIDGRGEVGYRGGWKKYQKLIVGGGGRWEAWGVGALKKLKVLIAGVFRF